MTRSQLEDASVQDITQEQIYSKAEVDAIVHSLNTRIATIEIKAREDIYKLAAAIGTDVHKLIIHNIVLDVVLTIVGLALAVVLWRNT